MKVASLGLAGIVVSCVLLAGCARSASAQSGEDALPAATYAGAIAETVIYKDAGVTLEPPSSTAIDVSWLDMYVDNCKSGDAICDPIQGPTIFLADATVTNAGEIRDDGSVEPILERTLVYVIEYRNVLCVPIGPPQAKDSAVYSCMILNFVDASSGKVLYSIRGTESQEPAATTR